MRVRAWQILPRWIFPSNSPGSANSADYEEYGYDAIGNRTSLRKRDGRTIYYQYDGANRLTLKSVPASASGAAANAVYYGYDVAGLQTYARFGSPSGPGIANAYDGLGRLLSSTSDMDGTARTVSSGYDSASNRTQLSASSGYQAGFSYGAARRMTALLDGAGTALAAFSYDAAGRRSGLSFLGGVSTVAYRYDALGRLDTLTHDLAGTAGDQSYGFTYNPASQIVTRSGSNDAYASNTAYAVTRSYTVNGLNQYTAAGPATFGYDANANLTNDGSTAFVYDAENRLVSASGAKNATLSYDPLGRLWQVSSASSGTIRFVYDGDRLIEEYDGSGSRVRVFAHGPGVDEPLVWWERDAGWQARFLHADHQGSIVSFNDPSGNALNISAYDSWGIPNAGNVGRFGYTGQVWLGELGLYYYKARMYSPTLGRFMQTDPVGYEDQVNLYGYVGNDPLNQRDPTGLDSLWVTDPAGNTMVTIPVNLTGSGATPDAVARLTASAASLDTGDSKLKIEIVVTDKPIAGVLNTMDYSPGFDFRHYREVGEGVNRVGGNRGHINSDATDDAGKPRDPGGALLHDILHFAGYKDGYTGGRGDGRGGRAPSSPRPGMTNDNIMVTRAGTRVTPAQSGEARSNRTSHACRTEIGSRIPRC